MADATRNVNIYIKVIGDAASKFKEVADSLKTVKEPLDAISKSSKQVTSNLSNFSSKATSSINQVGTALTQSSTKYQQAADGARRVRDAHREGTAANHQYALSWQDVKDKLASYSLYRIVADAIMNLKDAANAAQEAIVTYDQALKDLQAITSATTLEVEQMGKKIIEVASGTKFSAEEVAQGMRTLGQAGFSAQESIDTMQAVSDLATGTLSDMASSVDLVTTAMRVFDIQASQSGMVVDVFANAVNRSKLTIDKLRTSMNYVGPIAKSAGLSFQEMAAAMMTLANSGLRASTIGTGLRRILAELSDPSDKLAAAAQDAGIALGDLDLQSHSMLSVIQSLGLVVKDTQQAFDLFGKRGAAAVLALSDTEGQLTSMLEVVGRTGTAANMAATQMEGLGVSIKNLKDKMGVLAIAIGKAGVTNALRTLVDISRDVVDAFIEMADSAFAKFVISGTLVTATVVALVAAFQSLSVVANTKLFLAIAAGFTRMGIAAATTRAGIQALMLSFGPLGLTLILVAGALMRYTQAAENAAKASREAATAASELGALGNKINDYNVKVAGLDAESAVFTDTNKTLRLELIKVSEGLSEVADEAAAAADQIDPFNGLILDGGEALRAYADAIDEIQLKKITDALNYSISAIDQSAGGVQRSFNLVKDVVVGGLNTAVGAVEGFGTDMIRVFTANSKAHSEFVNAIVDGGAQLGEAFSANQFAAEMATTGKSILELNEYMAQFDGKPLTAQQQDLADILQLVNEQTNSAFNHLVKLGTIDTSYTVEHMRDILETLGIGQEGVDNLIYKFEKLQKIKFDGFTNIVEKWRNDLKDTENGAEALIEKAKSVGVALTANDEKRIKANIAAKQALADELTLLDQQKAKALEEEDVDKLAVYDTYLQGLESILKRAALLRRKYSNQEVSEDVRAVSQILSERDAALEKATIRFKGKEQALANARIRINREAQYKIDQITGKAIVPEELIAANKAYSDASKAVHEQLVYDIELMQAKGVMSHEEANKQKMQTTLDYYGQEYEAAKSTLAELDKLKGENKLVDDKVYAKAVEEEAKAEAAYYKQKRKALKDNYTAFERAKKDEAALNEKVEKEKRRESKKTTDLQKEAIKSVASENESYAEKVSQIEERLSTTREALIEKRVDAERKAHSDIISLQYSLEDKIRAIRQRDLTDDEKEVDNQRAATDKYLKGIAEINKARTTGDQEALDRGRELIEQAGSIYEGLKNTKGAEAGIKKVYATLEQVTKIQLGFDKKAIDEEIKEKEKAAALDLSNLTEKHNKKLAAIAIELREDLDAEAIRHKEVMDNIAKELAATLTAKRIARQGIDQVEDDESSINEIQKPVTPVTQSEAAALIGGISEEHSALTEQVKAEQAEMAENGYLTLEKNGKQFFTNMKDGQQILVQATKESTATMAGALTTVADSGKLVFNKVHDEFGRLIAVTAKGLSVKVHEPEFPATEFENQVEASVDRANNHINKIQAKLKESTGAASGIEIIGPEQIALANELAASLSPMFDGLDTEDPKQRLKDMITAMQGMGYVNDDVFESMRAQVELYASQIDGVGVRLQTAFKDGRVAVRESSDVIDEAGKKLKGLSEEIQSNPFELFDESANAALVKGIQNIEGAVSHLRTRTEQELNETEVDIPVELTGMEEVEAGKEVIDGLEDKEINIHVNYTSSGTPPPGVESSSSEISQFAEGGSVFKRLANAFISKGSGLRDDVPAMLTRGEFVLKNSAVAKYGTSFLTALNNGIIGVGDSVSAFANGGMVTGISNALNSITVPQHLADGGIVDALSRLNINPSFSLRGLEAPAIGTGAPSSVSHWNLTIGNGAFGPRGKVETLSRKLMDEVRNKY